MIALTRSPLLSALRRLRSAVVVRPSHRLAIFKSLFRNHPSSAPSRAISFPWAVNELLKSPVKFAQNSETRNFLQYFYNTYHCYNVQ